MIDIILISIGLILFLLNLYFQLVRSKKVVRFRSDILNLCSKWMRRNRIIFSRKHENYIYDTYLYKYTYDQMLYSFKPLKLEKWFTEEEIDYLMNYNMPIYTKEELKYGIFN